MNTIKFIIFIIIGIILFFILNKSEGFNIGAPWIIVNRDSEKNTDKLSGEPFLCYTTTTTGDFAGDLCYRSFSDASSNITSPNDIVYHIIPDTEMNNYRVDIEKCIDPYEKIMGTHEELARKPYNDIERVWNIRTKENNETKPLIPRKNLMREDDYYDTLPYNDIGEQIAFLCDIRKTQSKTYSLVCKSRKKFVLQAHGGLSTEYNTRIPQLFQVMLYKSDRNRCYTFNVYQTGLRRQSILKYDNSATDYKDVKIQGNKLYLALLEESANTHYNDDGIMEELVYSELSQLNSGHLYLNCNSDIMSVEFSNILYFKIDDYMYCFYTDETLDGLEINNAEQIRANLVNFLNPFMLYGVFLLDNDNTNNTLNKLNLEGFDGILVSKPYSNRYFSRSIYPNGVNLAELNITEDESARTFERPYSVSHPWDLGIDDVEKTTEMATMATTMQNQKYRTELSEGISGEQPSGQQPYFQDSDGNRKPVHFRKFRVDYPVTLVHEITTQVRSLLLSCCVEIDPNLLRQDFRRREAFNRLFPNGLTRKFPLLYFDIYTIDGFENDNNSAYSLDDQGGNYTSADMRLLVKEIIHQIYRGSKNDGVQDVSNFGYYQMFKTKIMLEKGYNEEQCRRELNRLYGQWTQMPRVFYSSVFNYKLKNKFLCVDLLQQVWRNYGYDYNTESRNLKAFSADVPIIFAKLFKTEYGESADVHIMCCIEDEDTSIRSIQKKGYWGCVDTPGYSEYTGPTTPQHTCEWYKTNSIARCNAHGHQGANDNCCICKMVKNINESESDPDLRPNVGPNCKVRECKQTLEDKNEQLSEEEQRMGIPLNNISMGGTGEMEEDYWEQENIQTGEMEGRSTIHPDNNNRIMEHTETAYRYVSDTDDQEYGTIQLITDGNEEGVLKETPEITVLCNYTRSEIVNHEDDPLFSTYDNQIYDVAGQIKCDIPGQADTDEAFYDGNLRCPLPNACASVSINAGLDAEYFPLPSLEGIQQAIPPVLIGSGNGG